MKETNNDNESVANRMMMRRCGVLAPDSRLMGI